MKEFCKNFVWKFDCWETFCTVIFVVLLMCPKECSKMNSWKSFTKISHHPNLIRPHRLRRCRVRDHPLRLRGLVHSDSPMVSQRIATNVCYVCLYVTTGLQILPTVTVRWIRIIHMLLTHCGHAAAVTRYCCASASNVPKGRRHYIPAGVFASAAKQDSLSLQILCKFGLAANSQLSGCALILLIKRKVYVRLVLT